MNNYVAQINILLEIKTLKKQRERARERCDNRIKVRAAVYCHRFGVLFFVEVAQGI